MAEKQARLAWEIRREAKRVAIYYEGLTPVDCNGFELQMHLAEKHQFLVEREREVRRRESLKA